MNQVQLIGRLTKDIEVKYTQSQLAVAKFTVVVDDGYGEKKKTSYISCIAFGTTAENMEKFTKKGRKIAVMGKIQTGSYEKDGVKHYTTDVIADRVEFIEWASKKEESQESQETENNIAEEIPVTFQQLDEEIPF